ncbi:MAG: hypothetical protein ACEPOV_08930 [Hyphomicrobiales bacterium]
MKFSKLALTLIGFVMFFSFTSCQKDTDNEEYVDAREKYIGTWKVSESLQKLNYTVDIIRDPDNSANVIIKNFADTKSDIEAIVTGSTLHITGKPLGEDIVVNTAVGKYMSSVLLEFEYALTISGEKKTYKANYTK